MCIRDSIQPDYTGHVLDHAGAKVIVSMKEADGEDRVITVSYTHLDVYKRQVCAVVKLADYGPKPPALARLNLQKKRRGPRA